MKKNVVILFTKVPDGTDENLRYAPLLTGPEHTILNDHFLMDICDKAKGSDTDVIVFFTPEGREQVLKKVLGEDMICLPQNGDNLGIRMKNAVGIVFRLGYERCVLIGSDCPHIHSETLKTAFVRLDEHDVVIHPTVDGGYCLIGMKEEHDSIWDIKRYGTNTVIYDTLQHMKNERLKVSIGQMYYDLDGPEDLRRIYRDIESGIVNSCPHTEQFLLAKLKERLSGRSHDDD